MKWCYPGPGVLQHLDVSIIGNVCVYFNCVHSFVGREMPLVLKLQGFMLHVAKVSLTAYPGIKSGSWYCSFSSLYSTLLLLCELGPSYTRCHCVVCMLTTKEFFFFLKAQLSLLNSTARSSCGLLGC